MSLLAVDLSYSSSTLPYSLSLHSMPSAGAPHPYDRRTGQDTLVPRLAFLYGRGCFLKLTSVQQFSDFLLECKSQPSFIVCPVFCYYRCPALLYLYGNLLALP